MTDPRWHHDGDRWTLTASDAELAVQHAGDELPADHSPRPFLHPIRTLAGRELTAIAPKDHPHHYGLSLAISSVNGTTFWGGRTYVRDVGSTLLENHGTQRVDDAEADGGTLRQTLTWLDPAGVALLQETRVLSGTLVPGGWALTWDSTLRADQDVVIESSATKGRAGAGYGGTFWRFAVSERVATLTAEGGAGEQAVHGSTCPWLHVTDEHDGWQVALTRLGHMAPWFARAEGYLGVGPALAFHEPLRLGAGGELRTGLRADITDAVIA